MSKRHEQVSPAPIMTPEMLDIRRRAISEHIGAHMLEIETSPTLRDYQREMLLTFGHLFQERTNAGAETVQGACVQFPGAGKTIEAAHMARMVGVGKQLVAHQPPISGLFMAPQIHLLDQAVGDTRIAPKGFALGAPDIPTRLLNNRDTAIHPGVMNFASNKLVLERAHGQQPLFDWLDLLLVDECDFYTGPQTTSVIRDIQQKGTTTVGFSATDKDPRLNQSIHEIWPDLLDKRDLTYGIENGYLSPAVVYGIPVALDDETLAVTGNRGTAYREAIRLRAHHHAKRAATILAQHGVKTIVFNRPGDHCLYARNLANELIEIPLYEGTDETVMAEAIGHFRGDNLSAIQALEDNTLDVLTSTQLGARGLDIAGLKGLVITVLNRSTAQVVQQLGRVLRKSDPRNPEAPAIIIFMDYSQNEGMNAHRQITPYQALDIPYTVHHRSAMSSGRTHHAKEDLPEKLIKELSALASKASSKVSQRSRYFVKPLQLKPNENNLAEVAAWTHTDTGILRTILRKGGYTVRQFSQNGKRIETCTDDGLYFLDVVTSKPGEMHLNELSESLQVKRETLAATVKRLGILELGQPRYSRHRQPSGFAPTPEHYSPEQVNLITAAVQEKQFDVATETDMPTQDIAAVLGVDDSKVHFYFLLVGVAPIKRTSSGKNKIPLLCYPRAEAEKAITAIQSLPVLPEGAMSHLALVRQLALRGAPVKTAELRSALADHGFTPTLYFTNAGILTFEVTPAMREALLSHFGVANVTPTKLQGPRPITRQDLAAAAPAAVPKEPRPAGRKKVATRQTPALQEIGRIRGGTTGFSKLQELVKSSSVRRETFMTIIAHHPETKQHSIGTDADGNIIIDAQTRFVLEGMLQNKQIPTIPFGWQTLPVVAEQNGIPFAQALTWLKLQKFTSENIRVCNFPDQTGLLFISPSVALRLEDTFL